MAKTSIQSSNLNIQDIPDDEIERVIIAREMALAMPWQYDPNEGTYVDPDGMSPFPSTDKDDHSTTREILQELSWTKFQRTPQVNTAIRGLVGRLAGYGFESSSDVQQIQEAIEETELDPRNRLYNYWPKYVGRGFIEGELFNILTCHDNGFIEVDFLDPKAVQDPQVDSGIIFHPSKTTMPLIYCIKDDDNQIDVQIPSIFIARYPELLAIARGQVGFDSSKLKNSYPRTPSGRRSRKKQYKEIGGFNRFVVAWDKSFITKRNIGHVRTVLEWLQYYEDLKKYEIDHKKSAGAYLWKVKIDNIKSYIQWLKMSDADRRKTGISAKKTPGSTVVLGPDMDILAVNPNLPNISDSDTDILHQVTSGLNEPEDISTGSSRSQTFAAVNASRGPMSDRTSDEISYFEKFLRHDFWGSIFFLKSKLNGFPEKFSARRAVDFDKNGEPVFKFVKKAPEMLMDISFPTSEINELEGRARGLLGVKHGALSDTLGIPLAEIAKRLGFENYRNLRLQHATEEDKYPKLVPTLDAESVQEQKIEPKRPKNKKGKSDDSKGK